MDLLLELVREGDAEAVLELCESIRLEGGVLLLKWDGERDGSRSEPGYTCLISAGRLKKGVQVRQDGDTLHATLASCVEQYLAL